MTTLSCSYPRYYAFVWLWTVLVSQTENFLVVTAWIVPTSLLSSSFPQLMKPRCRSSTIVVTRRSSSSTASTASSLYLSSPSLVSDSRNNDPFVSIPIWLYEQNNGTFSGGQQKKIHWKRVSCIEDFGDDDASTPAARTRSSLLLARKSVEHTWNWCQYFVRALDLCPWAPSSLDTPGAIQFFVVVMDNQDDDDDYQDNGQDIIQTFSNSIVNSVAEQFTTEIIQLHDEETDEDSSSSTIPSSLERAAIFFVLFVNSNDDLSSVQSIATRSTTGTSKTVLQGQPAFSDFMTFYEWFIDLEDDIPSIHDQHPDIIVAPFHPQWTFDDEQEQTKEHQASSEASIAYEKRSPYPTISVVSARVIEQAGEVVTSKIGIHNEEQLSRYPDVANFWKKSIFGWR